jgi:hypothetical protein
MSSIRRRFRYIFNALTALSLLLLVASAGMWIRSRQINDRIYHSRWWLRGLVSNESAWWLLTGGGQIGIAHRVQYAIQSPTQIESFNSLVDKPEFSWKTNRPAEPLFPPQIAAGTLWRLGFHYENDPNPMLPLADGANNYYREWVAPFWSLCLIFALLPAWWLLAAMTRRRAFDQGHCQKCGYDLRATPERCPECGTVTKNVNRIVSN